MFRYIFLKKNINYSQKRFCSNFVNHVSTSHKLVLIQNKIWNEINNKDNHLESYQLTSFLNPKLGDVCKMNNKNLEILNETLKQFQSKIRNLKMQYPLKS